MKKLLLAGLMFGAFAHAQLATKKTLTLEAAKKIVAAAEAEAVKSKFTMVICVVDDGGNVIMLERMDGTQLGSIQVAQDKAMTALNFKRPTKALEDAVAGGRNAVLKLTGAIPIEGGIPITVDGVIIGAVGASGGTSPQDAQVAAAGVKVAEAMK
ncbi:MAG: heme-binding protein [Bryobacteraceae bacterium]